MINFFQDYDKANVFIQYLINMRKINQNIKVISNAIYILKYTHKQNNNKKKTFKQKVNVYLSFIISN